MAATLGMGTITARSVRLWREANGKAKRRPRIQFENRCEIGDHPTKGWGHASRRGKRGNRS